jgi:putative tryptophan/tyrosine transport system substrate-binding protein
MRRRDFMKAIAGSTVALPSIVLAQQLALPVVGFINPRSPEASARNVAAFRKGLNETGYVEGQNVTVEYLYLEGAYDRLPAMVADLVRRQVAVIATPGNTPAALAAKAATVTIPIVFGVGEDPVRLGLVASLARPGGNTTGVNIFSQEVTAKRLRLLHDLVPRLFVLPYSSIRPMLQSPSTRYGTYRRPPPPSGCKPTHITLVRLLRSTRSLPPFRTSAPMPSSLLPTVSSLAAASNLPP